MNTVEFLRLSSEIVPDRTAIIFEDKRIDFSTLQQRVNKLADSLSKLGVVPGDRVSTIQVNCNEHIEAYFAITSLDAIYVPVNFRVRSEELEVMLSDSKPKVIFAGSRYHELVKEATKNNNDAKLFVSMDDESQGWINYDDLIRDGESEDRFTEYDDDDTNIIMYTSGTTGPSKGVLMPQGHCYLFALGTVAAMELTEDDRYFCCMPLFHANGLFMQAYASLLAGSSCHVTKRFSVTDWLSIVREEQITVTNALGVMPEFIFRSPESPHDRDHKLTRILAIPVAEEWGVAMQDRFGVKLRQGFGMTEVNMVTYSDLEDPVMAGCAGPPLSEFFDVIIADPETDAELSRDNIGEILVRPKVPFCFNVGYFNMPDKTVEAWRNLSLIHI